MRVAIVDDEQAERDKLAGFLARYAEENQLDLTTDTYPSGDVFLQEYRKIYDILLFDIDMPGTSGIDTARKVRSMDSEVVILFVTNIAQYAINGYEVGAADYLLKPMLYYDFAMKFRRAVGWALRTRERTLLLEAPEGVRKVSVSSILYVEVLGHYLIFHLLGDGKDGSPQELRIRGNMKDEEALLRPYNFCQIHKSYLVNLAHLEELRGNRALVRGTELPVGRAYKDGLVSAFFRYVRR